MSTQTVTSIASDFLYPEIPQELKTRKNWVCFRHEPAPKGKTQNRPYAIDGAATKVNDSSTWSSFEDAANASTNPKRKFDGISFMLLGTSYLGLDFDDVIKDGVLDPFVAAILRMMNDPYAEVSYSGEGLRVFVECPNLPRPTPTQFKDSTRGVEIYHGGWAGKALTVTGSRYSGKAITRIEPERFDLVYLLCSQINNEKFKALWLGDLSNYPSHSEADLALCSLLANLLGHNPEQIDAAFRWSGLYRQDKWGSRSDYSKLTIAKAMGGCQSGQPTSDYELTSCTADQIEPKKIVWLWQNRIAEKLNMLVGNPDNGKGLITHYIISRVTTGSDWYDAKNTLPPSEVALLSGEEDWDDTVIPRLMAAGADRSKVHQLKMSAARDGTRTEKELSLDRDTAALERFLEQHPDVRLVVIDPISNYLGTVKMTDEQRVRDLLTPLKDIASRKKVAVVCVMHLNKKVELDAIHRIGGAMAFVGVARMVWLCASKPTEDDKPSDERVMVKVKGNIVHYNLKGLSYTTKVRYPVIEGEPTATPYVEWIGEVDQKADEITGRRPKNPAHRPADQLDAAVGWLNEYLKAGAVPLDEVEDDGKALHGFSPKTIERARKAAGVVTFESGKRKSKDGKMRKHYSCKLSEMSDATDAMATTSAGVEIDGGMF